MEYIANGGQTYMPFRENIHVPTLSYEPPAKPEPALPELTLNAMAREKGWVISGQSQHFLPGVTAKMLDWWWANMEKGYYLWAPGSHKRFNWVREPWKYGFVHSAHMISESLGEGIAVFGGNGIQINRLDLSWFPFTEALEHVIVEGVFNARDEFVDMTVHMWQDAPGGCVHSTAAVMNPHISEPPQFVLEMLEENPDAALIPPSATDHSEYEASRWPVFLPGLYDLWKDHPDPTQSVPCDLRVEKAGKETWSYLSPNAPVAVRA